MQRRRPPLTRHSLGEARKNGEHNHILLKLPNEARVRDDLAMELGLI
jgi:hypothetical protein